MAEKAVTPALFGRVHFVNESGEIEVVDCATEADYFRELNAGADWCDAEPNRPLDVWGERFTVTVPA